MLCAISGEAPQVPVASRKSGNVFEKRLIEDYIRQNGTDPVNGEELSADDLVELKTARVVRPRPPTLTSIPSLLSAFQNEWDALALESYTLKQQLAQTRQELSTALYQHDAATRVIARLVRERDEARDALSKIQVSAGGAANGDAMVVDSQELPSSVVERIEALQQKLQSTRRKRPIPEDWATAETISSFDADQSTEPLYPGAQSIAVDSTGDLVLLGGADGVAGVYSISKSQSIQALKTGGGSVTAGVWIGDEPIVATSTGAIKAFEAGAESAQLSSHAGAVTSLSLHPTGDILASTGVDKSYKIHDLSNMKTLTQIFTESEITCGEFHPDGHLFAVGHKAGQIQLFDVKNGQVLSSFQASGPVQSISFSENGTWVASAVKGDTSVSVWDLRKANVTKTIDVGSPIDSITWDYTGQFLAVAGAGCVAVQQYEKSSKSWSEPFRKAVQARDVKWGTEAKSLITLTTDGAISILG